MNQGKLDCLNCYDLANVYWLDVFRIATCYVLPLYRSGALIVLLEQIRKYWTDITAIQGVRRWLGACIGKNKEKTIYYSCHEKQHT